VENRMILENVLHRPVRTAISIIAVALEVSMVLVVVGLTHGLLNEAAKRVEGVGADVMVQPPGSSFLLGLTSAPMTIKFGNLLSGLPHVKVVTPVLLQFNTTGGLNLIYGIDMQTFDQVSGGFAYHAGGPLKNPDDILVDDWYAKANHLTVAQTINLKNHDFHVAGIVEHGKGARLFIPLQTAEEMTASHDQANIFFVKCTDPGYTDDVAAEIRSKLPNYQVLSIREYMSLMTSNNLPALNAFIAAMIAVAIAIGFLVIFLSMYTTITERTREIGILKSLGASKGFIISIILRETALLAALGIVGGCGGAILAKKVIVEAFPTLSVDLTDARWWLIAALLALGGSLLGSFYPALRAAQLDPVDALAYE
jgi:putative ABC transport system permease protein